MTYNTDITIDWSLYESLDSTEVSETEEEDSGRAAYEAYIQKRIHQCCTFTIKVIENPLTGKRTYIQNKCGLAECPICGSGIKAKLEDSIKAELKNGSLRLVTVWSDEERAKLTRKYGKDKVRSWPVETSEGIRYDYLIKTDDQIGEIYTNVSQQNLDDWSKKVYKHSSSGNLCKLDKIPATVSNSEELPDDRVEIEIEEYIIDIDSPDRMQICREVEQQTIVQTADLLPTTIQELESALKIRRAAFYQNLALAGGVILCVKKRIVYIRESDINWHAPVKSSFAT